MTTYKCKCGRQVAKSTNADNTGNRDTTGCEGCPYLLPWGPTVWDNTRHAVVTDIKGYECRMSPELSYITELWGCVDDKCTMQINSLDFDFLERVSAWIKEHYPKGELSGGFSRAKMRACEFVAHGRYRMSICCAQNKAGMAAKAALVAAFFDPKSKTRLDIDPAAEKQLILNAIEAGKEAARQDVPKKEIINMDVAYKGPDGRLYRVSAQPDAKGGYYIEYRDPVASAVYKPLPGYHHNANRDNVVDQLAGLIKELGLQAVMLEEPAASPASAPDPCVSCLCNTCGNDDCDNAPDCYESKDVCVDLGNMAKCKEYQPKSAMSPASAEPPEIVDESSEQNTAPAALTAPPATDIAAPAFDYTQVDTDTANLLRELESGIAENQKTAVQVASAIGEKLQCGHDYLAKKGYGCYGEWCESLGYNRTQAKRLTDLHNFVCNTMLQTERDAIEALPLTVAYQVANPNMPEEVKEAARNGDISTLKELEALRAQLKATEVAKAEAEREKREALAWKQHAEGQAEDAKAAIHDAQQTAQEAQRQARQAEAKVEHQESMLAELQDRLDEANAQLRSPQLEATMVDKDELERRAQELADQKIAEALSVQERQPLCDLVITLNNAIKSAWSLSGIEDRDPESEDDDTSLEVLYETLYHLVEWVEERLAPDVYEQEEAIAT